METDLINHDMHEACDVMAIEASAPLKMKSRGKTSNFEERERLRRQNMMPKYHRFHYTAGFY